MESLSYKTISANAATIKKEWYLIDAQDVVLGRLASQVAKILRGKNKPSFTPHADCGDNVIIINCEKVKLTGNKLTKKLYVRHSGYPGGQKYTTPAEYLAKKPQFLKDVFFAGEVMPNKHLNYWRKHLPECRYANLYGPTEITVDCTYYEVKREFTDYEPLPIGFPCRNSDVMILVDRKRLAQKGEQGELCVRGSSLALGYYNNPEKTKDAFIQNPLHSNYPETIYCTGDIVYENEYGEIMYVGRIDSQIKHNGYRIELGEIETAILGSNMVDNCCVIYDFANKKIVMFYQASEDLNMATFRKALSTSIPRYMLPSEYHREDVLKQNTSGKIDRAYYNRQINK